MGRFFKDQRGIGQFGIIAAIIVIVVVGVVAWWVWDKNRAKTPEQKAIQSAECTYEDKDLCKFFAGYKAVEGLTIEGSGESGGQKLTIKAHTEGDNKSHTTFSGGLNYETIIIDNTLYTKAGDTWYKETLSADKIQEYKATTDLSLQEPTQGGKYTYTKVGTEACGDRTCYKYEAKNADLPDTTEFLWIDTKDYRLRRVQNNSPDGSFDANITYDKITISEPSPVKDLGEDQYIIPGQNEPTTLPDVGDGGELTEEELRQLLEQYQ